MVKVLKQKKYICLILIISILIGGFNPFSNCKISAVSGDWIILDDGPDSIFAESYAYEEYIEQVLYHHKKTNSNYYSTADYFTMTRKPYNRSQEMNSNYNSSIETSTVLRSVKNTDMGSEIKSTYKMTKDDFMNAVADLGITADVIRANGGTITVYLNTTFNVYVLGEYRKSVYGCQEMLAAGYHYFGPSGWGEETISRIKYFYNIPYILTAQNIFDVNVKAIDIDTNAVIKDLTPTNSEAIYNQKHTYNLLDSNDTITYNNEKYDIQNYWFYKYTERGSSISTRSSNSNLSSSTITISRMPDASSLTIYIPYRKKMTNYNYKIIAVDSENNKVLGTLIPSTATDNTKTVTYKITNNMTFNEKEYTYSNKWNFTYYISQTTTKTNPDSSGITISQDMPSAYEGSEAIFKIYYSTGPTPTPSQTPTPVPTITATPIPSPTIAPVEVPDSDSASLNFTRVVTTGVLKADVRGSERFIATQGIPTTESLYGEVIAKEYLLGYRFVKKVGIENFTVKVTRNYILKWNTATPASAGGSKEVTETVTVSQDITVPRAYGYWEIENLDCYKIGNAVISNYALPNGSITIYPNSNYYSPPSVAVSHSANPNDHIIPPDEVTYGIQLSDVVVDSDTTSKPAVPVEDFTYVALSQTGKTKVKSDYLSFNGSTVISNVVSETEAPDINTTAIPQCNSFINNNVLYKSNNIIDATKINGEYATLGTITYTKIAKVGSSMSDNPQYSIDGLNNVIIHTPVVCSPTITADNDKYVQLINPDNGCTQLVLDPDPTLSDFTIHISNTGFHSSKQGYYTRDFSKSIRNPDISYISLANTLLKNQVKFPFDVYIDKGTANVCSDDDFIKAGTWITIDRSTPRFYLPMTVNEGIYSVNFRTIAVNGEPYLTQTETYANTKLNNYVATNSLEVEVSGRIYGLKIYDISDYPMWQDTFRIKNSMDLKKDNSSYPDGTLLTTYSNGRSYTYTLGTNNQYGIDTGRDNKYTFPLVNGSHPQYKNKGILKTGYLVRFSLETIGNMFSDACKISIKPNFYYVDKDGKNRVAVDLYYTEEINNKTRHLVKVGSALDQINLKKVMTGDLSLGIPEKELKQTASLRGLTYGEFASKNSAMFNFSDIRLNWAFRTYVNNSYLTKVKSYSSYSDVRADGITDGDILERMQRWYGQYYLPNEVHVVAKDYNVMDYADKHGIDYNESFWLKDGYIIVNFTVETIGDNGSRRLSYINYSNYRDNGNCSMWLLENPVLSKTSYKGPTFNFYAGDFVYYYANKKMSDDYETGAIY